MQTGVCWEFEGFVKLAQRSEPGHITITRDSIETEGMPSGASARTATRSRIGFPAALPAQAPALDRIARLTGFVRPERAEAPRSPVIE